MNLVKHHQHMPNTPPGYAGIHLTDCVRTYRRRGLLKTLQQVDNFRLLLHILHLHIDIYVQQQYSTDKTHLPLNGLGLGNGLALHRKIWPRLSRARR